MIQLLHLLGNSIPLFWLGNLYFVSSGLRKWIVVAQNTQLLGPQDSIFPEKTSSGFIYFFPLGLCFIFWMHTYVYNMNNLSEMISTCGFSTPKSEAGGLWVHGQLGLHGKLQTSLGCAVRPCFRAAAATITTNVNVFSLLPSAFLLSFLIATLTHARKCAMVYSNGRRLA